MVTEDDSTHSFDDMIVKMASQDQTKVQYIKQQLATIDHTPDHPVYPIMIQEAIVSLNEVMGSTKDAISHFIVNKYDVFWFVHVAKLMEQLERLVEKEEIVFTSENRYMLPTESTSFPAGLEQGKKQFVHCEQDWRSNKLRGAKERVEIQEYQNAVTEIEDHPEIDNMNVPLAVQTEDFENQNLLPEDRVRVSEEELEVTGEKVSKFAEVQLELVEEQRCVQPAKGIDEGRHVEEIQTQIRETAAFEEHSQLRGQEVQVMEDQGATELQSKVPQELHNVENPENEEMKDQTASQVPQYLHDEEHSQLQDTHVNMQIETQSEEIGESKTLQEQDTEVGNNANETSHTLDIDTVKSNHDKATIIMPSSSNTSQQSEHAGSSPSLPPLKEKCINLWNKLQETQQKLMEVYSSLIALEEPQDNALHPIMRQVPGIHESEPKVPPHSVYATTDLLQILQNQQIELPKLKRSAEVETTALGGSFQKKKMQALAGNHERAPKYQPETRSISPALPVCMDSQWLAVEKDGEFPSSKSHLELEDLEKFSKSCLVADSSKERMESQLNLEQQLEHPRTIIEDLQTPVNLDQIQMEQQSDVDGLEVVSAEHFSDVVEELTPAEDMAISTEQVEPEWPPGFPLKVNQLSQEQMQCVVPFGDAKKLVPELVKEQRLNLSVKERPTEVEMFTADQKFQIIQKMQVKELLPQDESVSQSVPGIAAVTSDQQPHYIEMLQDPKKMLLEDESSHLINLGKNGRCNRKKIKVELPQRQLRPRGPKASESHPTHSTDNNYSDLTFSPIKLDGQLKLDHAMDRRPQKQNAMEVEKLSQSVEQGEKHRGKKKQLRFHLERITSDEVPMLEDPGRDKPTAGDVIQTQQQQQIQVQIQCSSQADQALDKTMEETPPKHQNEQKIQPAYLCQESDTKLKSIVDGAEGAFVHVDDQNNQEEQPSQLEARAELTMGKILSDDQTQNEQMSKKRGRGRPPKLKTAAPQTAHVAMSAQDLPKQKSWQPVKQRWPNGADQGVITRSRAEAIAETISPLCSQNQKEKQHTLQFQDKKSRQQKFDSESAVDNRLS